MPKQKATKRSIAAADIKAFISKNTRGENDSSNRIREPALTILSDPTHPFYSDAEFGSQWTELRTAFVKYVKTYLACPSFSHFVLEHKGGLANHHDFNFSSYENNVLLCNLILEFKNNSMPQFMQEFDMNGWTDVGLAEFWYDNGWLDRIIALYPQPLKYAKPSREVYLKEVHQLLGAKSKPSFFKQFYEFDHNDAFKVQYAQKARLSKEGIAAFLKVYGNTFKVDKLRAKCQAEQTSKKYFIWKSATKVFEFYEITDAELAPSAIARVTDNTVVLKAGPSELHCLLRLKNTLGICCPAWQISLHRTA